MPLSTDPRAVYMRRWSRTEAAKTARRQYERENNVRIREKKREWRQRNRDRLNAEHREKRAANPEYFRELNRTSRMRNAEKSRWRDRQRHAKNKEARNEQNLNAYKANRAARIAAAIDYRRRRLRSGDINYRLAHVLRCSLRGRIKYALKAGSAIRDLGCTIDEFRQYIERLWLPGMSWENWSFRGWHLDHVRPLSSFDLTDREQAKAACHYTNLQPLWAIDNHKKGGRLKITGSP